MSPRVEAPPEPPALGDGELLRLAWYPAGVTGPTTAPLRRLGQALGLATTGVWSVRVQASVPGALQAALADRDRLTRLPPPEGAAAWWARHPLPVHGWHVQAVGPAAPELGRLSDFAGAVQALGLESASPEALAATLECVPDAAARAALGAVGTLLRPLDWPVALRTRAIGEDQVVDAWVAWGPGDGGLCAVLAALPSPAPAPRAPPPAPWVAWGRAAEGATLAGALALAAQTFHDPDPVGGAVAWAEAAPGAEARLWARPQGEALQVQVAAWSPPGRPAFGPTTLSTAAAPALAWGGDTAEAERAASAPQDPALWQTLAALGACGALCLGALWSALPHRLATQTAPGVVALRWPSLAPQGPAAVAGDREVAAWGRFVFPAGSETVVVGRWPAAPGAPTLELWLMPAKVAP